MINFCKGFLVVASLEKRTSSKINGFMSSNTSGTCTHSDFCRYRQDVESEICHGLVSPLVCWHTRFPCKNWEIGRERPSSPYVQTLDTFVITFSLLWSHQDFAIKGESKLRLFLAFTLPNIISSNKHSYHTFNIIPNRQDEYDICHEKYRKSK